MADETRYRETERRNAEEVKRLMERDAASISEIHLLQKGASVAIKNCALLTTNSQHWNLEWMMPSQLRGSCAKT